MGKIPTFELMDNCIKVRKTMRTVSHMMGLDLYFEQRQQSDVVKAVFVDPANNAYYHITVVVDELESLESLFDTLKYYFEHTFGNYLNDSIVISDKDRSSIYPSMMNMYDMDICSLYPTDKVLKYHNPITPYYFKIEKVIFNDPATIVIWADGSKTVVKCQPGDTFDKEKGLAMAISKRALGDKGRYCEEFKKWIPVDEKEVKIINSEEIVGPYADAMRAMKNLEKAFKNHHVTIPDLKIEYPKNLFGLKNVKEK